MVLLLDPKKTAPFVLGEEGAPKVIVVHGFTGTPWDVLPMGEALAKSGFRAIGIRLPGHGKNPEDTRPFGAKDWHAAVEDALLAEAEREPLFLAGHSMGALLCVCAAARYPAKVRALAALAPAMQFVDPFFHLVEVTRAFSLVEAARPWISKKSTDIGDDAVRVEAPILPRYPAAWLRDLISVRDEAAQRMGEVRCPTLLLAAENDHVVSMTGVRRLAEGLRRSSYVRLVRLTRGFHGIARDRDGQFSARETAEFFNSYR